MNRDWRDFKSLHSNLAGAREAFENACESLFRKYYRNQNVQQVQVKKGDGGIDIFIGNYGVAPITVIQCKFFLEEVDEAQKDQIRKSFKTAIESDEYELVNWILAIPRTFVQAEHKWWSRWKEKMERKYSKNKNFIQLKTGNELIDLMKEFGIYEQVFQIRIPPSQKILSLLKHPSEWYKDIGNRNYSYHIQYPEFNIKFSETEKARELFSFFYLNSDSYLGEASFYHNSTKLFELDYIYVDEMRQMISIPSTKSIELDGRSWFYYYDLSSINGSFYFFLTDGALDISVRGEDCQFIFFDDERQRIEFEIFLRQNFHRYDYLEPRTYAKIAFEKIKEENFGTSLNPIFIDKVRQIYEIWRLKFE